MTPLLRAPIEEQVAAHQARALPWATVIAGSLLATLPIVTTVPLMPPFGLLMLLAWRLLAPLSIKLWAPALLGLFDDLVSGQPLGSAMCLWQLGYFLIALVDRRSFFRDFWQDWAIAAAVIVLCLAGGRLVATPIGAHVDPVLLCQTMVSILAFPIAARTVAWIDRKRGAP